MSRPAATRPVSRETIRNSVDTLPRVPLAHLPTPLEEMPRFRDSLGSNAPRMFVKRDDLTGLALGGNKVRHLEFRLADIRAKGADTLIVTNVAQSNHARLHTALAARFGLTNYILKLPSHKDSPVNGNLLLDHMMGARIVEGSSQDQEIVDRELAELVTKLEAEGRTIYVVPKESFSKIAGTCGYLLAALEILEQLEAIGAEPSHLFLAAGTSSAGLALAGKLLNAPYRVHPVSVRQRRTEIEQQVCGYANKAAELLGFDVRLTSEDIEVHDEYVGEDYGIPTPAGMAALQLAARTEGLILEPVYTAKTLSALIDQVQQGRIGPDDTVVFVHTGGLPITFAYSEEIMAGLQPELAHAEGRSRA
jgi:1-aminocyclopropane-1-carboxylate deaminase/D-cysteine desulfhydrase-like pyridoxal-dependent ACC family enzyme